jgi:hypothetical protein
MLRTIRAPAIAESIFITQIRPEVKWRAGCTVKMKRELALAFFPNDEFRPHQAWRAPSNTAWDDEWPNRKGLAAPGLDNAIPVVRYRTSAPSASIDDRSVSRQLRDRSPRLPTLSRWNAPSRGTYYAISLLVSASVVIGAAILSFNSTQALRASATSIEQLSICSKTRLASVR